MQRLICQNCGSSPTACWMSTHYSYLSTLNPTQAHRLDAPTGGLLLVAKTRQALQQISADLACPGTITKQYIAIVKGRLEGNGIIDMPLGGKRAVTEFRAEQLSMPCQQVDSMDGAGGQDSEDGHTMSLRWQWQPLTLVSLWPKTGRTHQLRKHMAYTGLSILGDSKYRGPRVTTRASVSDDEGDNEEEASSQESMDEPSAGQRRVHLEDWEGLDEQPVLSRVPKFPAGEYAKRSQQPSFSLDVPSGGKSISSLKSSLSGSSSTQGVDRFPDGSQIELCLWAIDIRLRHPVTRVDMHLSIPQPRDLAHIMATRNYESPAME